MYSEKGNSGHFVASCIAKSTTTLAICTSLSVVSGDKASREIRVGFLKLDILGK